MVEFGNKHKNIIVTPAPERKKKPEPSEDTTFGGEPELSETPVIDEEQAAAPVEPDAFALTQDGLDDVGEPEPQTLKETVAKVSEPKPKPKKKKGNRKHNKKKRRHGR